MIVGSGPLPTASPARYNIDVWPTNMRTHLTSNISFHQPLAMPAERRGEGLRGQLHAIPQLQLQPRVLPQPSFPRLGHGDWDLQGMDSVR